MIDSKKSKKQLIEELELLRQQVHELKNISIDKSDSTITECYLEDEGELTSENKFKEFFDHSPLPYHSLDENGIFLDVNPNWLKTLGYNIEEVIGKNWVDFLHPDWKPLFENKFPEFKKQGFVKNVHFKLRHKNGHYLDINLEGFIGHNPDGSFRQTYCVFKDITEHKKAEEALKDSEQLNRAVIENSPLGISVRNKHGKLLYVNQSWKDIWQVSEETVKEYMAVNPKELKFDSKDSYLGEWQSEVEKVYHKGDQLNIPELCLKNHSSGEIRWISQTFYAIKDVKNQVNRVVILTSDVTKQKLATIALFDSEEKYRQLYKEAPTMMHSIDLQGKIISVTHKWLETLGYEENEVIGRKSTDFLTEESRIKANEIVMPVFLKKGYVNNIPYQFIKKNGEIIDTLLSATSEKNSDGVIVRSMASIVDITEKKRAEKALQNSEEQFRTLVESTNVIPWRFDLNKNKFTFIGKQVYKILGHPVESWTDLESWANKIHASDREHAIEFCAISTNKCENHDFEYRCLTPTGDTVWIRDIITVKTDKNGNPSELIGFMIDITETKRLQELESRAQRLETAGIIAGQVAHDFNNLLAPMMAYPEIIREELPKNHPAHHFLDQIEIATQKITDINQDLLSLGRRGHYNQKVLNLNTIVLQAIKDLEPYPDSLACELNLNDDLLDIFGGASQIHRMLSNLFHNARDAMKDIGKLIVKTENYYVDEISDLENHVPIGEYVKLTITDTGCGISDDIVQKIFDPFFTSKTTDKKRGSGLGMSVVDAVINDHNGYIDLMTKIGEGTSFYIYFPITRKSMEIQNSEIISGGDETILVVDDDDIHREVSSQLLNKLGYQVNTVESGEKAIEFLKQNPHKLVILDMVMPGGIDGTETYRQILKFNPDQKAIILSGFSESDQVMEAQKLGAGAFVKKPISRKVIALAVRTELNRKKEVVTT